MFLVEVKRWFAARDVESRWRRIVTVDITVKLKIVRLYLCDVPINLPELRLSILLWQEWKKLKKLSYEVNRSLERF